MVPKEGKTSPMEAKRVVRIGCWSAFWGDSSAAARQLCMRGGKLDYMVGDYLAEVTMAILARAKQAKEDGGFVPDFVYSVWKPLMKEFMSKKIKIVTNAGGLNPMACKEAIEKISREGGIEVPVVAVVTGDDLLPRLEELRKSGQLCSFSVAGETEPLPPEDKVVMSVNAYLGARPIAAALARGAQIVITGRCVDSALVLGPLMHEFGWRETDYDLLAAGSLAGHIIECGCQATGGNFTDWQQSASKGWHDVGFPIVECTADGGFVVTKPAGTGGVVCRGTVTEQILYEIGDPAAYVLPDVVADFRHVRLSEVGSDRVAVRGARGAPPTPLYKVSATTFDGYRSSAELVIGGIDARAKAEAVANAILTRTAGMFRLQGLGDYSATNVEVLGTEHTYGPHSRCRDAREVVLRIAVRHANPKALQLFAKEIAPAATAMAPGITGGGSGRPKPSPLVNHFSALVPKRVVPVSVMVGALPPLVFVQEDDRPSATTAHPAPSSAGDAPTKYERSPLPAGRLVEVPLIQLCYGRSGDKGDVANIGLIARDEKYYEYLKQTVTSDTVKRYMGHLLQGTVTRYELPGLAALNFVCTKALGGGGLSSLNIDRQGKTYAQQLLTLTVHVPEEWVKQAKPKL